jgi:hypothetical protein
MRESGPALRCDSGRATPLPHPLTTRCCGGTPHGVAGGLAVEWSRIRLRAVGPGTVAPFPHPLIVWCHEDSLLFGSRARHCTGPGQHKCVPFATHRERSEPGTSPCRSRYTSARAVRPGPGPWTRHGGHLLITRACDARALRSWLASPSTPRGTALPLSFWSSAQAYAPRCSLPNRLARSRRG